MTRRERTRGQGWKEGLCLSPWRHFRLAGNSLAAFRLTVWNQQANDCRGHHNCLVMLRLLVKGTIMWQQHRLYVELPY